MGGDAGCGMHCAAWCAGIAAAAGNGVRSSRGAAAHPRMCMRTGIAILADSRAAADQAPKLCFCSGWCCRMALRSAALPGVTGRVLATVGWCQIACKMPWTIDYHQLVKLTVIRRLVKGWGAANTKTHQHCWAAELRATDASLQAGAYSSVDCSTSMLPFTS